MKIGRYTNWLLSMRFSGYQIGGMKNFSFTTRTHLILAVVSGIVAGLICYHTLYIHHWQAADYTWLWRASRDLRAGRNPYKNPSLSPSFPYPNNAPLYYPLPAVLMVLPLSWFPAKVSAACFSALSVGLLSFVASRKGLVTWLLLLSPSCYRAVMDGHWSPFVVALALIPGAAAIAAALKPNIGAAVGLSWPTKWAIGVAAMMGFVSVAVLPSWPLDWLHNLEENRHVMPISMGVIALPLLIAMFSWRHPTSRLMLLMAVIPQRLIWNDQLVLHLIPRTIRQQVALLLTSWIGYLAWIHFDHHIHTVTHIDDVSGPVVILFVYLPALEILLWQLRPGASWLMSRRWFRSGLQAETR